MDRSRKGHKTLSQQTSRPSSKRVLSKMSTLSQNAPGTSSFRSPSQDYSEGTQSQMISGASNNQSTSASEEEIQLVGSVIRYLFALDGTRQVANRSRIIKNVLGNKGKLFHPVMSKVRNLLSKVFGYKLLEIEDNKYILVNELQNDLPHIKLLGTNSSQQVLLFLVLTHIFMQGETCPEENLWDFLEKLGINSETDFQHAYFGNVKRLITEDFVFRKYLDKTVADSNDDSTKVEFKWGPRAQHEFSRRDALQFVSEMYNGRSINSWPIQFKAVTAESGK